MNGNKVNASTSYSQDGCTGIVEFKGMLQMYWGFEWRTFDSYTAPATNGGTTYMNHSWTCLNSNMSPWRTAISNKYTLSQHYIINYSSTANLPCGN